MTTLADLLSLIRARESQGNYSIAPWENVDYPNSHASGAYQFEPATWRQLTQEAQIGTQYAEAYLAPPAIQDAIASFAASNYDPNSTFLWRASAPPGGYPIVDQGSQTAGPGGGDQGGGSMGGGTSISGGGYFIPGPPGTPGNPAGDLPNPYSFAGLDPFYPTGGAASAFGINPATGLPLWQGGGAAAGGAPAGGPGQPAASSCSLYNPLCWWQALISWLTAIGADLALGIIAIIAIGGLLLMGANRSGKMPVPVPV